MHPSTPSRSLLLTTLLAAAVLAGPGCKKKEAAPAGPAGAPTAQGQAAPPAGDVILLGEVGSLTGSEATFGVSQQRGIALAVDEVNARGGIKGKRVAVRVYDDQGRPEEAAQAATRLIAQDRVALILGEVASSNSLAMAEKAQAARVPMIATSSTNPAVTRRGDYIFRVCFIDPFQGQVMAKFTRENLELTRVAVLGDNRSDYSMGLIDVFTKKFGELGGQVVANESYSKGDTDFRAQLTALKRQKPEAVFIPGYYTDVGIIARQARELGLTAVLLGADGWESDKLFELGGSAIDGSYFSNHYAADNPSPVLQQFIQKYKARFGSVPDSVAALAYDAAQVAFAAMERAPDLSGPALRDAIAQTKDFPGVAGRITLDADRNAQKEAVVLKVEEGRTRYVATVAP